MFQNSTLYGFTLKLLDLSKCGVIPDDLDQELKYNCIGLGDQQFITKNKMDSIVSTKKHFRIIERTLLYEYY